MRTTTPLHRLGLAGLLALGLLSNSLSAQLTPSAPVPPCCTPAPAGRNPGPVTSGRQQQGEVIHEIPDPQGSWQPLTYMPRDLGELSAGVIDGKVYVVGRGHPHTLRYDPDTNLWVDNLKWRPFKGDHHGAEVFGGKLYLIGGLKKDSEGTLQIYDPMTDTWTLGAPMPFAAGSLSTALIGGKIYAAGGILDTQTTTNRCAVYDPIFDSWTELAPMPFGRNHTASGTDGTRLWVFGGRGPGSGDSDVVANGFADVQVYDPSTDTWVHSGQSPRVLPPLPQARGGLGKAIWLGGQFYVFGGETDTGAGANAQGVYGRVDVFSPTFGFWRRDTDMLTARHGAYPVRVGDKVIIAGGGISSGGSQTTIVERFEP